MKAHIIRKITDTVQLFRDQADQEELLIPSSELDITTFPSAIFDKSC